MTIEHDISFEAQCRRPGSSFSALLFSVAVEIEYFLFSHSGTSASIVRDAGRNEIEFHRRFEWFTHLPVSEGRLLSWNIAATMCLRKTFGLFYIFFIWPFDKVPDSSRHDESPRRRNRYSRGIEGRAQHRTMSCNMAKNVARPFNNFCSREVRLHWKSTNWFEKKWNKSRGILQFLRLISGVLVFCRVHICRHVDSFSGCLLAFAKEKLTL